MTKTIITVAVAALLLTMTPWQNARAASGTTSVTIDFPNIIILHYPTSLTLTFTGAAFDTEQDNGPLTPSAALADPATFNANLIASGGPSIPGSIAVTVENVWAVRGISDAGTFSVNPAIDTANATNGGSTATMSNLEVQTAAVAAGDPITINAPGFAIGNAVLGDILFDLDISGVTSAAAHTGMQYTIDVSAP